MMRPRIAVTQRIHDEIAMLLSEHGDLIVNRNLEAWAPDVLLRHAREADALMVFMPDSFDAAFIAQCLKLKVVAAALKGFDNFDVEACRRRKIWFTIVPDLLTQPTAELALALLLALSRQVMAGDAHVRSGDFQGWRPTLYGRSLWGATAGLIGYGSVGHAFEQLVSGFQCSVIWYDIRPGGKSLETVAAQSDFVLPLLPLTADTKHIIDRDFLSRMKAGAFLINVGRGSLVDEEAVCDSLENGTLAGYAADVFEMEDWARNDRPLGISTRLLSLRDRTLFTPHLGSATSAARFEIERRAAQNIIDALGGTKPRDAI